MANSSSARVSTRMPAERIAGRLSGINTCQIVLPTPAPQISEASSRLASMRDMTALTVRKT
jgi:hypothetical protein